MTSVRTLASLFTLGALVFIDFNFIIIFVRSDIVYLATGLEQLIFVMQISKTILVASWKSLRDASPSVLIDIYGAELLLLPVLLLAYFFGGGTALADILGQLIRGWMVGVAFAGLPFSAYRLGKSMLQSASLTSLLPSAVVEAELSVVFLNAAALAELNHTGMSGVASLSFLGKGSTLTGSPLVLACLTIVYVSLLLYAILGADPKMPIGRNRALSLALIATASSLVWLVSFSYLPLAMPFVFLPPTLAILAVSWWVGRAA